MPENIDLGNFWSIFAIFTLLEESYHHHLFEGVLSFKMSSVTLKSVKN